VENGKQKDGRKEQDGAENIVEERE